MCEHGMHFCRNLVNCFYYYVFKHGYHVAKVRGWGVVEAGYLGSKMCESDLEIVSEVKDWYTNEDLRLELVKLCGQAVQYMDNPSKKVQLEAVKQDGHAISWITHPSEELQLMAVRQNGLAIDHIDNPIEKVQLVAVNQDPFSIDYIVHPTEKVCRLAHSKGF